MPVCRSLNKVWQAIGVALWLHGATAACGATNQVSSNSLPNNSFVCQAWQVENGLPQNSVMAILQTKDRYLWIGTANGLARFDGVNFKRFGLADGLPSLFVRAFVED